MRLLRSESLDEWTRETGPPASFHSEWRDTFLERGLSGLMRRSSDPRVEALEQERKALQAKVGELPKDKKLLEKLVAGMKGSGDRIHNPCLLDLRTPAVWQGSAMPAMGRTPIDGVCPPSGFGEHEHTSTLGAPVGCSR
ncbi:hypothetical protein [Thioalkalivibrio sp. ALE19]|uniref:hypothetical protein n=1 Tax=Thioalkalivibrio sp. ALE19 TaxID=1266909 RepID=UPI00049165E0|nr:hypothetical protein [Thioalkalivibrio sp. ALE19]